MVSFLKPSSLKIKSTILIIFTQIVGVSLSGIIAPIFLSDIDIDQNLQAKIESELKPKDLLSDQAIKSALRFYMLTLVLNLLATYIAVSIIIENFLYDSRK